MYKKKIKRRIKDRNIYWDGGEILKSILSNGQLANTIANGVTATLNPKGNNTTVGNILQGVGSIASNIPGIGGVIGAGASMLGGVVNSLFGSNLNDEFINQTENNINAQRTYTSKAKTNDTLLSDFRNFTKLSNVTQDQVGSDGLFSDKAKNKTNYLNNSINAANNLALHNLRGTASNVDKNIDLSALSNFANGGPIFMRYSGVMSPFGNTFKDGGKIHIKPENRGKFTALKKRTGKPASWFKEHGTPSQKKMATFALNARKWKHDNGGPLFTHGGIWSNGLTYIDNGGTHEENPMEGVLMGIDNEGTPNLVEQGEVIFNDYVFSDRLSANRNLLESMNLPKNYDGYSFAAIAEKLGKESKERPNDPISKRGLLSSMSRLQQAQEIVRQNMAGQEGNRKYAHGGRKVNKFDGFDDTMFLDGTYYGDWQDYGTLLEPLDAEGLWEKSGSDAGSGNENSKFTWLRYAPVIGSAIGLAQNIFSRPDYSSADTIFEAANDVGNYIPVDYKPIGNYLQYKPFDRDYYINKLNAQAGSTRRALMNTASPSRNAALLAADYNAQGKLGDLARQAEEYNLAQRQAVETFNRATNMANSEMGLKAAMANQKAALKARSSRLIGVAQAMAMRDAIDSRRNASMSANLTNLFDNLGNIGIDTYNREDRDKLIRAGVFGVLSEKPQEWSNKRWEDYKKAISGTGYRNGGRLKKRRGGFTY